MCLNIPSPITANNNEHVAIGALALAGLGAGSYFLYQKYKQPSVSTGIHVVKNPELAKKEYEEALSKIKEKEALLKKAQEIQARLFNIRSSHRSIVAHNEQQKQLEKEQLLLEHKKNEMCLSLYPSVKEWWNNQQDKRGLVEVLSEYSHNCKECAPISAQLNLLKNRRDNEEYNLNCALERFADYAGNIDSFTNHIDYNDKELSIAQNLSPQAKIAAINSLFHAYVIAADKELQGIKEKIDALAKYEVMVKTYQETNQTDK